METPNTLLLSLILLFLVEINNLLPCTSSSPSQSATPPPTTLSENTTDHLALLSFKASISSDPRGALTSWNESLHFCEWQGVMCGARKHPQRVTALDLDSLNLAGFVSPYIANLTFLRRLNLPNNQLQGQIPQEIDRLKQLQYLNLSYNSLDGEVPANLSNCLGLQVISLSNNMLVGGIPIQFGSLSGLVQLSLYSNNLTGSIPPSLGNLSALTSLILAGNNLEGNIPENLGTITSLQSFQVAQNILSGKVPFTLYNITSLSDLNLGGNQLSGTLPPDIGHTLPNLQSLSMYGNQFEGPIPMSISNASQLEILGLNDNMFNGPVPPNLGALQSLSWVILSENQLEAGDGNDWSFLASLTNCSYLEIIELYDNKLRGKLPNSIANLTTQLQWLSMGINQISGSIPKEIENLVGLNAFFMERNLVTGVIPATIGKLQGLQSLWLFDNKLSGEIPFSLGNLTQLNELYLEVNELQGSIPTSFRNFNNLITMNLSYNNLSGNIPREVVSLTSLSKYLDMSFNSLTGALPLEVGSLKNLKEFNVSNNRLTGEIPSTLGECEVLEYLYMGDNFFQGSIPQSLSNLKGLQEMDLSQNNLSGQIPEFLVSLQSLQYLNLSFNNLHGEVPTGGVFGNISASSVLGNDQLCGGNPKLHLHTCSIQGPRGKITSTLKIILPVASVVLFSSLLLCLFVIRCRTQRTRKETPSMVSMEDNYVRISFAELHKATDGFSSLNLIGAGSFGYVYKGILDSNGEIVAVKVLNLERKGASKSFIAECEALRTIRHRNLVKVLTSCSSVDFKGNDFKALVFEFMPNGNLDEWLHPQLQHHLRNLSLVQRVNIAIDVASALDYLHHHGQTPIIHCDLKPSNVLLDNDMCAHVGDFGLARFLSTDLSSTSQIPTSSIGLQGSIGYVAPEYGMGSQVSTQGDVYSYGIFLLEMLTGLRPTNDSLKDGLNLHKLVAMAFPNQVMEIVDPQLLPKTEDKEVNGNVQAKADDTDGLQECLVSVIGIGLKCSKEMPRHRMEMRDVLKEMHTIRDSFLGVGIHEEKHNKAVPRGEGLQTVNYPLVIESTF